MKIGVICDCFKMPLIPSIKLAADSSFDGIQIYGLSNRNGTVYIDNVTFDKPDNVTE